ncbi:MAG: formyl transferase [Chitinophagaceae bacterium]|nr:formyl transferase [Chitinophagaceae bacterium]
MMFQILVVKSLNIFSKKRKTEIINQNNLINTAIPNKVITNVSSVNDDACKAILNQINPDIIVVNGTRIISKKILSATNAKIINMHAGITPNYRGVHGAYWALVNKDNENCGVTIHFVDAGIDTGNIIYQQKITITKQDNFVTYPFLQLAAGLPFLSKAIADISDKSIKTVAGSSVSALWSHPTIWQYLLYRVTKNVK